MAPIKTSKKNNLLQQKIAARLIEISLKVDDYIYNKKLISVEAAREYGEEVAHFLPKCQGDARSLQVIEKLTSVMKNIIEEHSKSTHDNFPHNQSNSNLPTLNDTPKSASRSKQVKTPCFSETKQISIGDKETMGDSIDKSDKTNTENVITEDLEVDLERTISNLSLSIIDTFNKEIRHFKGTSALEGSQHVNNKSIDKIDVIELASPDSKDCSQHTTKITTPQDKTAINTIGVNSQKPSNKETSLMVLTDLNVDLSENHIVKPNILPSINVSIANDFSATEPYGNIAVDASNLGRSQNNNPTKSKMKRKAQNKGDNKKNRKNNETQKTKKSVDATRRGKVFNTSNNIPENVKVQNKKKSGRSNNKKGDVSDLSWIDNLKYVRVINDLEYNINLNVEDSFWDNCSLPPDWNDYF